MRIDAHHHFWTIGRYDYPWMRPELGVLRRNYGPEELAPILGRHQIDASVLVQTISSADETRWFLELARRHPFIAGVVGWADLTAPSLGETLDALRAGPKLVGLRHVVHDEPDPQWLLRSDVQRGLGELQKRSFPYDLLIRPAHLETALQAARNFPELPMVVDHIAKPEIARQERERWAAGISALAQRPNVWCKLSGMITEADWAGWKPGDLKPYIERVLQAFGTDRVMFGSDWPVCLLAGTYDQVVEALQANVGRLSKSEREKIFGGNAARFYRLKTMAAD